MKILETSIFEFFWRNSRWLVLFGLLAGILSGMCNAALLAAVNNALKNGSSAALIWSFAGLCMLLPVTRFASEALLTKLGQDALYRLRSRLCHQILAAPLRHLEQLGPAHLMAALTEDIPAITNAIAVIPLLSVNAALVIGCLAYMAWISWVLFAIVAGFLIVGTASYQIPIVKVEKVFRLARKDADALQKHFRALTQGAKELKIHGLRQKAFLEDELDATAKNLQRHNTAGLNMYSAASSWGQALVFVVIGLIVFVLPSFRESNHATLVAFTITLLYMMTPLQVIMNTLPQTARASVALKTVRNIGFSLSSQVREEQEALAKPKADWWRLEFVEVTHGYHGEGPSDDFVLGPLNISFSPGEVVFIIGGNGSGKTTLVKLLTGLYAPESGHIRLDRQPVDDSNRDSYRQMFSAVFSDFFLFDRLLGLVNHDLDGQSRKYLDRLKLSHKVQIEDGKLSTTDLSQGQRKRLALLTAYVEDRPIYVFDEWAADQDPYFKNIFYTELLPELKARRKTVFVISHDDRYYWLADRIVKLDEGRIVSDVANRSEHVALGSVE